MIFYDHAKLNYDNLVFPLKKLVLNKNTGLIILIIDLVITETRNLIGFAKATSHSG